MPSFVSPGVYVIEKDLSNYPVAINPSVVGIVGFSDQGPINKATLITSQESLTQTFGNPREAIYGQGLEGSLEILETTNSMYFIRSSGGLAKDASSTVILGSCPALEVSAYDFGVTQNLYLSVQINSGGADIFPVPKEFNIPSGTSTGTAPNQALALKKIIGGALDGSPVASFYDNNSAGLSAGWFTAGYAGSGVVLTASAWSGAGRTADVGVCALMPVNASGVGGTAASTVSITGVDLLSTGASSLAYSIQSLYPGVGYNVGSKTDGTTSGYSSQILRTGGYNNNLQINRDGAQAESFRISTVASGAFAEDVINTGGTSLKSQYIKAYFTYGDADAAVTALPTFQSKTTSFIGDAILGNDGGTQRLVQPRFVKFKEGTYNLAGGTNGDETVAQLQGISSDKTGVYALDDDTLNISMALVPGTSDENVQNALVTLAESTQNFLAVVSPPQGLTTVQQAIDWSNGQSDERTGALNSSYAAIYWPWVKTFDTFSQSDRWFDPSIYAVRQMAYTDDVSDAWFAPAGVIRGRLTKPTDVEISVNQGDRDSMYSGGNVVNPIVNFPQQGIMIFGQRTAQRDPTALDRVNVRRLMIIIRKQLLGSTRRFVFEPNDAVTWEKVVNVVNPLLDDIQRRRGLVQYKVVCDETTNTPIRVDRNELWCKVLLKPTKAAEIVVFELNLTNQSATL